MKFTFMSTMFAAVVAMAAPGLIMASGCDEHDHDEPTPATVQPLAATTAPIATATLTISGHGKKVETVTATFVPGGLDLSNGPNKGTHGSADFCVQDKPGEESPGVCCEFGGHLMVSCEIVSCKADGHCYDYEP